MKTNRKFAVSAIAAAVLLGLGGCGGMSTRDQNTAIGAGGTVSMMPSANLLP